MITYREYRALNRIRLGRIPGDNKCVEQLQRKKFVSASPIPTDCDAVPEPYTPRLTQVGEDAIKEYRQSCIRFWIPTVISFFAMLFAGIACFTR